MEASDVTPSTLCDILLDHARRSQLLGALEQESGCNLPLANATATAAERCIATREQLAEMVNLLVAQDADDRVLNWLVLHPDIPEHSLHRLLDAGRCVDSLGHRKGPEELLIRIAAEHPQIEEAVLTLALIHYGPDPERGEQFLKFVSDHLHIRWLRESLRSSDHGKRIPSDRRAAALGLIEHYEKQIS